MSDKTRPNRTPSNLSPLAIEVYFDQTGMAAGSPLAPQREQLAVDLRRRQPRAGPAPWALGRVIPTDEVPGGHILDDSTCSATITGRPGDVWGFGSVA